MFLPNGITILPPKGSHQKWSSAYSSAQRKSSACPSAQRWSLACPLGRSLMSSMVGFWSHQAGAPEGHLPHRSGDSIHICHPCGIVLHNVAGTHHGHSRLHCCFQPQGFWGCLVSSCQQWVPLQTGHHFSETQRGCHLPFSFQQPSW